LPTLYDITKWELQPEYGTKGTRDKVYVQSSGDNKFYYFKQSFKSIKNEGKDYFFEFWSEVIATEIGQLLGFNVLRYGIAIRGDVMGCISESMISEDETLTDGGQYLRAFEMEFDPKSKDGRRLYSFQLIEDTLEAFELSGYIEKIIEIIIFDSIIGNGDRHQENWAFINNQTHFGKMVDFVERTVKTGHHKMMPPEFQDVAEQIFNTENKEIKPESKVLLLFAQEVKAFAPNFDNGSSLGRELESDRVDRMLKNEQELVAYINRGKSEIRWESNKMTHFELIKNLLESSYAEITEKVINRVIEKYDYNRIRNIVLDIDYDVPIGKFERYKLPKNRKLLIIKLVTLRIERLKTLLHERL
jgi:hypothetical protein